MLEVIICPKCGARLGDGAKICVVCGLDLATGSTDETDSGHRAEVTPERPERPDRAVNALQEERYSSVGTGKRDGDERRPESQEAYRQQDRGHSGQGGYQQPYPYQQQGGHPRGRRNWQTHLYRPGQPNQCPSCRYLDVVYYYDNGSAYCSHCGYRFYWRRARHVFDSIDREFDKLLR